MSARTLSVGILAVVATLATTLGTGHAQTEVGGWSVTGTVELRGAEHRTSIINSTLAILSDGTYMAAGYIGCGRAQYCEPGTWARGKREIGRASCRERV